MQPNYTFRLKGFSNAKTIYLAGDFNNWSPNTFAMKKQGSEWVLAVHLSAGKHLYKLVVDGKWIIDPANKLWEQNEQETGNSVLWIED
ncbi:MAG: glycoside hydrolase [Bacteroidota bacterium]